MADESLLTIQQAMGDFVRGLSGPETLAMPEDRLQIYQEKFGHHIGY